MNYEQVCTVKWYDTCFSFTQEKGQTYIGNTEHRYHLQKYMREQYDEAY